MRIERFKKKKKNRHNLLNDDSMISFLQSMTSAILFLLELVDTKKLQVDQLHRLEMLKRIYIATVEEVKKY